MLRYSLVLAIAATGASALATGSNLRLRGGAPLAWNKIIKLPDTLKEGFSTDSKLEVNHKSDVNGGTGLKATFHRKNANSVSSTLKATTSYQGVDFEVDCDGNGDISAEAVYKEIVKGGDVTLNAHLNGGQKIQDIDTPHISGEYRTKDVVGNLALKGNTLDASAVVEAGDIQIGVSTSYNSDSGKLAEPSLAARYSANSMVVTAQTQGLNGDNIMATYAQTVNDKMDVAGSFCTNGNKFSVGAGYKLDADSNVCAKINSDGILNVGYKNQITKGATVSAGLEVDTHNTDKRKFGLSAKIM